MLGPTHSMRVWVSETHFEAPLRPHTALWALGHPPTSLMGGRHQSARFRRRRSQHTPLSSTQPGGELKAPLASFLPTNRSREESAPLRRRFSPL